ncbi:hypothetical protein [Acidipila sp. EB88]|uniref:hypothetical protein n=1 Tax=Acidipila sp. EB88 TaxID=2305226 RepID=UPI000F9D86B4|nr:hypothetical protein [Acidipila sp. EB88]RRA49698.1 hypothetical protein D1Y84_16910 [Acidipila sp. EB88]
MRLGPRSVAAICFAGCLPAAPVLAQVPTAPGLAPATAVMPTAPAQPKLLSMLDQPPTPAQIDLSSGRLTIRATNSSLLSILHTLESQTGTKVEGLGRDERIFGVYGPGNPQDVLGALLDDSGYNVLISGRRPDGSPREVILSARTTIAPGAAAARTPTQAAAEDDEQEPVEQPPVPQPLASPLPAAAASSPQQIKTPQQMLEELQRLRQSATPQQGGTTTPQQ